MIQKPCDWCGHEHPVTALCPARPKWSRRGFLSLAVAGAVGALLPGRDPIVAMMDAPWVGDAIRSQLFRRGDVITIEGHYAMNPHSHGALQLQPFVVMADVAASDATIDAVGLYPGRALPVMVPRSRATPLTSSAASRSMQWETSTVWESWWSKQ